MEHGSAKNLGFLLTRAARRWSEDLVDEFAAEGYPDVKAAHGAVLVPLFDRDGIAIGEVMEKAGLSKQTMTSHVAELEREGLVRRAADPKDARRSLLWLTPAGKERRRVADRVVARVNRRWKSALGDDAYDALRDALARVAP